MITKLKSFLLPAQSYSNLQAIALVLLRLVVGVAFIMHGWGKIQNPMGWMPETAGVPGFLQLLAAVSEFGGGIALILGLLTRIAGLGIMVTMFVATLMHAVVLGDPFVAKGPGSGSYELALVYFVIAIFFVTFGPGQHSADKKIFG